MKIISITSGKGGVGKSQIAANFAAILAQNGYKTALLEVSDLPNLDIILNAKNGTNLANFINGECDFNDIFNEISSNLYFIASDGCEFYKFANENFVNEFFNKFKDECNFDFIIIDTSSGISKSVLNCIKNADENIIITLPTPSAISDAYAMIKFGSEFKSDFLFFVNFARDEKEAVLVFENLKKVAKNNIKTNLNLNFLGFMKKSEILPICDKERKLVCDEFEYSNANFELKQAVSRLLIKLNLKSLNIKKPRGISGFLKKISNLM